MPRRETEAEGYRIQRAVHDLLLPQLGARAGYKIGCTSAVMQQYLNIPHPCSGGVFERGVFDSGARLRAKDFVRVGVECEIAVQLARDLAPSQAPFTADSVAPAIEAYLPAIEIVDDRYADWQTLGAPTLVADDFFAAGCVLGTAVARAAAPDLVEVIGRAVINGVEAGRGSGADVLGHPHNALAWLANHLAAEGKGLARRRDRADREPGEDGVAQGRRRGRDGAGGARQGGGRIFLRAVARSTAKPPRRCRRLQASSLQPTRRCGSGLSTAARRSMPPTRLRRAKRTSPWFAAMSATCRRREPSSL